MRQNDLFDTLAANAAKERAILAVDAGARDAYRAELMHAALCAVRDARETPQRTLTTDDVWAHVVPGRLTDQTASQPYDEPRLLGAIMRQLATEKLIAATDQWRLSVRVANHRRPLRVWRVL